MANMHHHRILYGDTHPRTRYIFVESRNSTFCQLYVCRQQRQSVSERKRQQM